MKHQIVIVSDLHLSEGWNPETKRLSRNEDFYFDVNFRRFLQYLSEDAREGGFKYRLIINGDFVDFLQVTSVPEGDSINGEEITERERKFGLSTSPKKTVWKLGVIMDGHWIFFSALKEFISNGNEVVIVPGNHDLEWIMPDVQKAFIEALIKDVPDADKETLKGRIQFLPWFYYDPELSVYVEHGCQYDELNSFDYFLYPFRPDKTLDLPAGSFFVRYLFNRVEYYYPFADNIKPASKFIGWALKKWATYRHLQILHLLKFFYETIRKAGKKNLDNWYKETEQQNDKKISQVADCFEIDMQVLRALKDIWVPSAIHHATRFELAKKFVSGAKFARDRYIESARSIQRLLGVCFVVFGHTHEADLSGLSAVEERKAEYVNSGTWTKAFAKNYEDSLLKSENEFVYVHIKKEDTEIESKMNLLRWNDSIGAGERVRLFEERSS